MQAACSASGKVVSHVQRACAASGERCCHQRCVWSYVTFWYFRLALAGAVLFPMMRSAVTIYFWQFVRTFQFGWLAVSTSRRLGRRSSFIFVG